MASTLNTKFPLAPGPDKLAVWRRPLAAGRKCSRGLCSGVAGHGHSVPPLEIPLIKVISRFVCRMLTTISEVVHTSKHYRLWIEQQVGEFD